MLTVLVAYEGGGGGREGEFPTMCYIGILKILKGQATSTGLKYGNGIGIHAVKYQGEYKNKTGTNESTTY